MSEPESTSQGQGASADGGKLYTLSEVSNRTGISMPTLQRYKKLYQNRIPSVGKGRKQRYPESALPVFDELKSENAGKRGRPRKDASATSSGSAAGRRGRPAGAGARKSSTPQRAATPARKGAAKRGRPAAAAAPAAAPAAKRGRKPGRKPGRPAGSGAAQRAGGKKTGNLLTLTQVSEQTGISYPTLVRYVRVHSDRLASEGTGRSRRFYPEAVSVFRELRQESGRGGRKKGSTAAASKGAARGGRGRAAASKGQSDEGVFTQRLRALERTQQDLEKRLRGFVSSLQKLFK